jgi:hypothetical protein
MRNCNIKFEKVSEIIWKLLKIVRNYTKVWGSLWKCGNRWERVLCSAHFYISILHWLLITRFYLKAKKYSHKQKPRAWFCEAMIVRFYYCPKQIQKFTSVIKLIVINCYWYTYIVLGQLFSNYQFNLLSC